MAEPALQGPALTSTSPGLSQLVMPKASSCLGPPACFACCPQPRLSHGAPGSVPGGGLPPRAPSLPGCRCPRSMSHLEPVNLKKGLQPISDRAVSCGVPLACDLLQRR